MKRDFASIFAFLLLSSSPAFSAPPNAVIRPQDLRPLIEEKNLDYGATLSQLRAAREREGSWRRSFGPQVHLSTSQEQFRQGDGPLETGPTSTARIAFSLYRGGLDRIEDRILSRRREATENQVTLKRIELLSEARELFWTIRFSQEKGKALEASLKANALNRASAERRIKAGVATRTDRLEFEMRAVQLQQDLTSTQYQTRRAENLLKLLLGFSADSPLRLEAAFEHEHQWQKEVEHRPEDHEVFSRGFEINAEILRETALKNRRELWPQVSLFGEWHRLNGREADRLASGALTENVLGLRLDWAWDGLWQKVIDSRSLEIEAQADLQRARFERSRIEAHLQNEIGELELIHSQLHAAEEVIQSSELYERLTQDEYRRGVKNSPDVLGASEKLLNARLRYLEMILNFQVARGHLLARLDR